MKMRVLAVLGVLWQACGGEPTVGAAREGEADEVVVPSNDTPAGDPSGTVGKTPAQVADVCAGDAEFDITVSGQGLSAWEGRRVVVAAIENDLIAKPQISARPVLVSGRVQRGAFSLSCSRSLHVNYGYPSWAVFIDVDDDGKCGGKDVGYQMQLYGWNSNEGREIALHEWSTVLSPQPQTGLYPPIGNRADEFCAGYFE